MKKNKLNSTKVIIIAFLLCITNPLTSKGQGIIVNDPLLTTQSFNQMGASIDNLIRQYEKAKQQYETMKNQYKMTEAQIAKLKKVSVAVMNFASTGNVVNALKELSSTFKTCGKAYFASEMVPKRLKEIWRGKIDKLAKEQDGIADKFALANQVDGVELTDKDRIDLILSAKEDAKKLQRKLDNTQASMDYMLAAADRRKAWYNATEYVSKINFWDVKK